MAGRASSAPHGPDGPGPDAARACRRCRTAPPVERGAYVLGRRRRLHPHRHRLGGAHRARGARAAGGRRHLGPRRQHAVVRALPAAGDRRTARRCCRPRSAPGSRWRPRARSAGPSGSAWTARWSRSTDSASPRRATRRSRRSASPAGGGRRRRDGRQVGEAHPRHESEGRGPVSTAQAVRHRAIRDVRLARTPAPAAIVIFGATGDLTQRKLHAGAVQPGRPAAPAARDGDRRRRARGPHRRGVPGAACATGVEKHSRFPVDDDVWDGFARRLRYISVPVHRVGGLPSPGRPSLEELDAERGTRGNRLFYLATAPEFFPVIAESLGSAGLAERGRRRRAASPGW